MAALFPGSRYYVALSNYLTEPHEEHLLSAQELGRELVARDVPPEEIGALHDDAMARLTFELVRHEPSVILRRTTAVLLEVLMAYGLAFRQQVAELKRRELALQESEARFRSMTANVPGAIFRRELASDGVPHMPFVSPRFARLFGHSPEAVMGDPGFFKHHLSGEDHRRLEKAMRQSCKGLEALDIEVLLAAPDGPAKWMRTIAQPRRLASGDTAWDGIFLDVTEHKHARERIEHLAHHYPLTDLPNRHVLNDLLERTLARHQRYRRQFAVLWIDLDGFKAINDGFGHAAGDAVLCEVAARLTASLRGIDTVARIGGDEFIIVVEDINRRADVDVVARKVQKALARPMLVHDHRHHTGASIGIALFPGDGQDAESLLRNADRAMYRIKESRHGAGRRYGDADSSAPSPGLAPAR